MRSFRMFALLLAFALVPFRPAIAAPALWAVQGSRATVYLFGTIHLLKPETAWRTPVFAQAFAASRELWLELPAETDPAALQPLILQYGIDSQHALSSQLSSDELARVDAVARGAGISGGASALDHVRPWLVGLMLQGLPVQRAGYRGTLGVDNQLAKDAKAESKPVRGFETFQSQIRLLASLSEEEQRTMLSTVIDDLSKDPTELDALVREWLKGESTSLDRAQATLRQKSPVFYQALILRRNAGFADRIAALAKGSGTSMVAIGAAHLSGPDGVLGMLTSRGILIEKMQD